MEQYLLTQEDIDRLGITDAVAGEPATIEEMKLLGLPVSPSQQDPLPPAVPVEQQTTGITTPIAPATNAAAPAAAPAMGGMDMMGLLNLMNPVPQDPFENLSRSQRTMLGFAALKDAGMALQGKEGGAVKNVMADITERADMERKRQAALAQRQLMAKVIGGEGALGGMGSLQTAEDYRNAASNLARQIAVMGDAGQSLIPMLTQLQEQAKRLEGVEKSQQTTTRSTAQGIQTVEDLINSVETEQGVTGFWGMMLGKLPWTKARELRIDADTLRSNMALDALKNLKATGATLGSVSEAELRLLESEIAQLNLDQSQAAVLKDLNKIQSRYQNAIRAAYRDTNQPEKLDAIMQEVFGGVPNWIQSGNVTDPYTFETAPQGELVIDPETGKVYRYKGGARNEADSWQEVG